MKTIVVDLDQTLCFAQEDDAGQSSDPSVKYVNARPDLEMIAKLREYRDAGFRITVHTARNMRTYRGDVDAIRANTLPLIVEWLRRHDVPHDDIVVGKPWCGFDGFYVDDRAIRPSEFRSLTAVEIRDLLAREASS